MASGMTNDFEGFVIDHFLRGTSQGTTSGYMALYSIAPGEAGGGTELTVALGYAREAVGFGADTDGVASNAGAVTFTAAGGAWSAIVGHSICDASVAGNILMYEDSVSGPTLADGDSYQFGIGDIEVTFI